MDALQYFFYKVVVFIKKLNSKNKVHDPQVFSQPIGLNCAP